MSKFESYSDGSACLVVELHERDAFKELIQRGANLWPDAPPAIKELADHITNGEIMQDYYKQAGVPTPEQEKQYPKHVVSYKVYVQSLDEHMAYSIYVARNTKDMGSHADDLMHATIGLVGEAGEIADAIKKHWVYGKKLDRENVKEELGDILFYLTNLLRLCDMTLEEVLDANVAKLDKRYPGNRYTDEAAIARADKNGATPPPEFVASDKLALEQFLNSQHGRIVRNDQC